MLVLETVAKIRRAYFVQRKTIKAICRELRVSRKVVRKVLRSEATEFHYERGEQPLPRIGPWQEALDELLALNEAKPARERLTLIRVFEELRGLGYEGGYDAVRRYARVWRRDRAATSVGAFIPLSFAPAGPQKGCCGGCVPRPPPAVAVHRIRRGHAHQLRHSLEPDGHRAVAAPASFIAGPENSTAS